jgi:hypothetical protein
MEYYYVDQVKASDKKEKEFYLKNLPIKKLDQPMSLTPQLPKNEKEKCAKEFRKNKKEFM